jgi:hypothetical protein
MQADSSAAPLDRALTSEGKGKRSNRVGCASEINPLLKFLQISLR